MLMTHEIRNFCTGKAFPQIVRFFKNIFQHFLVSFRMIITHVKVFFITKPPREQINGKS